MLRTALLVLLPLLALGAVILLLAPPGGDAEWEDALPAAAPPVGPRAPVAPPTRGVRVPVPAEPAPAPPAPPLTPAPDLPADAIPRGTLEVLPLQPDGRPWPTKDVNVSVEREGERLWSTPLGRADAESGVWTFADLPVGRMRIQVTGDFVIEATGAGELKPDAVTRVEVLASPGGMIRYRATLYGGEEPARLTLALLKPDRRSPVRAWFQDRRPGRPGGGARAGTSVEQGPIGVVFGLPAGRYVLRATRPEDVQEEYEVTVVAGETSELEIQLSR